MAQSLSRGFYLSFNRLVIYPSIWVAAAIASLGIYTQEILNLGHNWQAISLIFVTALIPYNLDRIFDSYVQQIPDSQAQSFFRQPGIWLLLIGAVVATAVLLFYAPTEVKYISIGGIVPLLYGTPLFPRKVETGWRWYRLKDIPGSKAWIVGSVLTYAAIALPLGYAGKGWDNQVALTTLFMFVFIVTNSHIFDVRDIDSDRDKGVVTLPVMAGVQGTKLILTAMNLVMLLVIAISWINSIYPFHPEMIAAVAVNLTYIWLVTPKTPRWVYNIWIEAGLFVPLLLLLAFNI